MLSVCLFLRTVVSRSLRIQRRRAAMARLLLGSGGFRTPERVAFLAEQMRSFFGPLRRLLFVPYALADHDRYVAAMIERGIHAGYDLDGIHRHRDPVRAVREAE